VAFRVLPDPVGPEKRVLVVLRVPLLDLRALLARNRGRSHTPIDARSERCAAMGHTCPEPRGSTYPRNSQLRRKVQGVAGDFGGVHPVPLVAFRLSLIAWIPFLCVYTSPLRTDAGASFKEPVKSWVQRA
jgi:hypothetical protein